MDWDDDSPCRPRSNCGQLMRPPGAVGFMTMPAFERAKREAVNRHRRLHPLPATAEGRGGQEEEEKATSGQRVLLPHIASPPCSSRWQSARHRPVSQRSRSLSASANLELNGQHRPIRLKQRGRQQTEPVRHLRSRSSITASELGSDDDDKSDGQAYLMRSTRSLMIPDGEADAAEDDLSEGELDRSFPGLGPAMDVMPVLPNALIEHVASMGFDAKELEARILPYYVGRLVVAYRDMSIADLVPFYFNVFKDLTSLPSPSPEMSGTLSSGRYTPRTGRAPCYELHVSRVPNFLWPVFEMVEYEFGAEGEGAVLDNVVILLNLPSTSTATDDGGSGGGGGVPSEAMDDPLMPMLMRLMLSKAGQVRSISVRAPPASEQASHTPDVYRRHQCGHAEGEAEHDHNDHGETGPAAADLRQPPGTASHPTRRHHLKSVVFVEMETEQEAAEAVRCLEGFPWSVDRILQARKFRDYGREVLGEGAQSDPPPPSSRSNAASSFMTDDDDSEALSTSRSGSSGYTGGGRGVVANVVNGLRPPSQTGAAVEPDSRPVSAAENDREGVNEEDQDEGSAVEGAGRSWREILAANERALEALRLRLHNAASGATEHEEHEDPAASGTTRWGRAADEVVDDLLTALRGGPVGAEVGALEEQLNFAIDRMDHETARELEQALLKAYVRDSDIRRAQDEDVVVAVQERNGDAALAREVEQAIGGLFDQRTGSTDSVGAAGNVVQQKVKLVEGCLMAERLRSAELMRRLRRSETRTAALRIEAAQKLTTINLMQNQRTGMLNHIRHLRHANQAVAIRNQELLSRLTSHLQVLGRVEVLQERLMECEERMAHAAAVATVTTSGPTTSTTPRARPSSRHQQVEDPLEGLERAATLVQSSVGDGDATATLMTVERLSAVEKGLEDALKAVRRSKEEKIKEEQINLMRHKEPEEAEKLCCICQDSAKSVLLLPCRHLCLCSDCSGRTEVTRCPVCRVEIEEKMTIYA